MAKIDSRATINRLKTIFARFGLPLSITADNGRQFVSQEMKNYLDVHNVRLISTTPFWPQMNGEVERQNSSLLKRMIIYQNTEGDWRDHLHKYLLMYRSTPHTVTLRSPAELMFGRNIRDKLPGVQQPIEVDHELVDRDKQKKHEAKEYGDTKRRAKESEIQVGDTVVAKRQLMPNKLATPYEASPYTVVKRNGSEAVIKPTESAATYRRNVAHLKKLSQPSLSNPLVSDRPQEQPPANISSVPEGLRRPPSKRVRKTPSRFTPD